MLFGNTPPDGFEIELFKARISPGAGEQNRGITGHAVPLFEPVGGSLADNGGDFVGLHGIAVEGGGEDVGQFGKRAGGERQGIAVAFFDSDLKRNHQASPHVKALMLEFTISYGS